MTRSTMRHIARSIKDSDSRQDDRASGVHYAEVTDVHDPKKLGRIKVRLDYQKQDEQTGWLPPKSGFHGDGFGSTFDFPMVGDKVKIEHILNNVHNMVWSPAAFHPQDKGEINSVESRPTPLGYKEDAQYDARRKQRKNIWKSMSGWLMEMIEGTAIQDQHHAVLDSPTGRTTFRWYTPRHRETRRNYDVVKLRVDDLMVFWDTKDGTAHLKWDALHKFINLQMHQAGQYVIKDHSGGKLVWDDSKKIIKLTLPRQGLLSVVDNIGGSFRYNASKSEVTFALLGDFTVTAMNIRLLGAQSITIATPLILVIGMPFFGNFMVPAQLGFVQEKSSTPHKEI